MADTKGMSTLQSVKLTCSEINDETTKMKTKLDKWLDASRKGLEVPAAMACAQTNPSGFDYFPSECDAKS